MSGPTVFRSVLWGLIALLGGFALYAAYTITSGRGAVVEEAAYGAPFRLVDQNGAAVTEAALRGRPSAVFFGFTHCPDVCPTTLSELAAQQAALKAKGKALQVVFVSVDPERDTPAVMKDYVGAVSPDIIALTGAPADVAAMLKGWGIYSKKIGEGPDYSMDHTASTLLLDAGGRLRGTIAYGEDPKDANAKLDRLVEL